ncbi:MULTISPECIES: chitin disaccharide deacetylase [Bacillaceae]|uniref:chitin disaccharide deacetylase n=1 Tax=Bacillaceae TaxID=186817 RepID=UPI0004E1367E|nr:MULTISPECIES: chitin disaccharide deacetylase [Bacillaceae]MCF2648788.1 chitin disaccharide deacetylase [Niallia circulans]MCM3363379.1 chitin disaccharide deacetylase [Niallia sp. MER TA 168]CAI9396286.1 Chitooligosaccharide deacetylase ChbG [Bacillus sp. T2.9-1]
MTKVIINADDFGLSRGVNYGIIDAHLKGLVTSATMMMNAKATKHAISLAKDTPSLKVGVHLVLTWGRPLLEDVPSLIDEAGNFKKQIFVYKNPVSISLDDLEREWTAQIEKCFDADLTPSHLDSHHHVHGIKEFYPVIKKLSEKYGLPVRNAGTHFTDIQTLTDVFLDDFYGDGVTDSYFENLHEQVEGGKSIEIMTHPAYLDETLMKESSYNMQRLKETRILMDAKSIKQKI